MGYLQRKDLDEMRQGAIRTIRALWTLTPDTATLYSLVVAIATLLHTSYYENDTKWQVYTSADVVASRIGKYSELADFIVKTRNLICHYVGTPDCTAACVMLRQQWQEVHDLLDYHGVLDNLEAGVFSEYFSKMNIQKPEDQLAEYRRLSELYVTNDVEVLAKCVKEDLL